MSVLILSQLKYILRNFIKYTEETGNSMIKVRLRFLVFVSIFASQIITGCSVNPVTGEKQLMIVSESEEFQIGREQYSPAQQSQGGQYYLDPELTLYVRQVGQKLAKVSDRPDLPYEFVVLNNSVPNAWALPSGKIAINRGLLVQLEDEAQLAAVLGHEIVHAAARHSAQRMQQGMLTNVAISGLGIALQGQEYSELILGGAALGANLTVAKYGRDDELESDHYGMKYMSKLGYDLNGAVELQKLFVKMSEGHESGWIDGLFASHPPSPERVEKNIKTVQDFPSGTFRGRKEFDQGMSYLRKKMPAYDTYDKAVQEAVKKNYDGAFTLVNTAIKTEPNEAMFYALRGDLYTKQGKDALALKEYDKAVSLYPELYSSYLKRGEANKAVGNLAQARADLAKSNSLLPTSVATLGLGQLALASGNKREASNYFAQASTSGGSFGQQAKVELTKLELPTDPAKYFRVQHLLNKEGTVIAVIENRSVINVEILQVETTVTNAAGSIMEKKVWSTKTPVASGKRSAYLPPPIINPLPAEYRVNSKVVQAREI